MALTGNSASSSEVQSLKKEYAHLSYNFLGTDN